MAISAYLDRIGYQGPHLATRQVLFDVHRAHLRAITYENLDIHLGRTLTLEISHIFDKIVNRHRGGWCYEMNSLTNIGTRDETIQDEATYRRVIREQFDLQLSEEEIATLWQIVWEKHQAYLSENSE